MVGYGYIGAFKCKISYNYPGKVKQHAEAIYMHYSCSISGRAR